MKRFKQTESDEEQDFSKYQNEKVYQNVIDDAILEEENEDQDSDIDISSLKVSELRLHLKERGLDQFGLKKDLQKRLQDAINEENKLEHEKNQQLNDPEVQDQVTDVEMTDIQEDQIESNDIESDMNKKNRHIAAEDKKFVIIAESLPDVDDGSDTSSVDSEAEIMEIDDAKKDSTVAESSTSLSETTSYGLGQFIMKAASKFFSPGTKAQQPNPPSPKLDMTAIEQPAATSPAKSKVSKSPPSNSSTSTNSPSRKRMSMVCGMSLEEIKSENESVEKTAMDEQTMPSRISSNESTSSIPSIHIKVASNSISKSNAEKMEAIREARAARLQQIRNKVNQIPVCSAIKSTASTSSILNSKLKSSGANPEEERKRAIAEKMRQKALTIQSSSKPISSVLLKPVVLSTPIDNKKQQEKTKLNTEVKKVLSPMDTYQMSDREESESETSENENEEPANRKPVSPSFSIYSVHFILHLIKCLYHHLIDRKLGTKG